ncbi:MAG: lipopolysaccharide kinase InaA family protein [Candidatus Aminicenantes bacterium]|nr:lipopolysaccharide kinase InaA family protein [Candidatus Aminicenantes bacterium]
MKCRPLSLPPYEGRIADAYAVPEFLSLLAEPEKLLEGSGAEVLLDGRNRVVAVKAPSLSAGTADIVIKEYRLQGINKLKSRISPSKAAKAWRGAAALEDAGFETPAPIAFLERRKAGFVERSYFIAGRVFGGREIRDLFKEHSDETLRPLLSALAGTLFRLHERGILHRDLSDGNVLVKEADGAFRFIFLDTNRVRSRGHIGATARAKNLVRLGVPPALRTFFLERYAAAGGRPLEKAFVFWYKLNKNVFSGWIKLKRALRLKKLARWLKIQ